MGKVKFVLNGKEVCAGGPGPKALRVIEFIKSIPEGKYFDSHGIGNCLSVSGPAIEQLVSKNIEELEGHYLTVPAVTPGRKRVFGSKKSVAALKKQLQEQDLI